MADIDVDTAEGQEAEAKPKPKPKPPRPKGGGGGGGNNMMTIITAAIAVAAIVVCGLLAWQVMQLQSKLGDANIQTPAGLGGEEDTTGAEDAHGEGHGEGAGGDEEYTGGWEDNPVDFKVKLAKFTAKTADGKAAVVEMTIKATSGITFRDTKAFEAAEKKYEIDLMKYQEAQEAWFEENQHSLGPSGKMLGRFSPDDLVVAGFFLMHGGAAAAVWPDPPVPPEPPKTILEQKMMESEDEVREVVIDEINDRTAAEMNTRTGRDIFKSRVLERLDAMFDDYLGTFNDIVVSEVIST